MRAIRENSSFHLFRPQFESELLPPALRASIRQPKRPIVDFRLEPMDNAEAGNIKFPPTSAGSVDIEWQRLAHSAGFKVAKLAEITGVSMRTLQRHFRAQYGLTVSEWLKAFRLREAGYRIKAGGRIKQVALDLGYKQLSHFSREFKRAYGQPPRNTYPESAESAATADGENQS